MQSYLLALVREGMKELQKVDFDDLAVDEDQQKEEKNEAVGLAKKWKKEGMTVTKIVDKLKEDGYNNGRGYSNGAIGNWTKGIK